MILRAIKRGSSRHLSTIKLCQSETDLASVRGTLKPHHNNSLIITESIVVNQPYNGRLKSDAQSPVENGVSRSRRSFQDRIRGSFIEGSGIDPDLFDAIAEFHQDIEVDPGGEVRYPIHEALNWERSKFPHKAHESLKAFFFRNEDGSVWQAVLERPDKEGRPYTYMAPKGAGNKAYLPPVNREIRRLISQRYDVEVPPPGQAFWEWLEQHPEIPIIITEGGKKTLALLSQGFVAIGVYGCSCLKSPDLERFCLDHKIIIALDEDSKPKTRHKVSESIKSGAWHLRRLGADVQVSTWDPKQGKGIDDLLVNCGTEAVEEAITSAAPFDLWRARQRQPDLPPATLRFNVSDLSGIDTSILPKEGAVAIISAKGTGKTKLLANLLQGPDKTLAPTHRVTLGRNLAERLDLTWHGDITNFRGRAYTSKGDRVDRRTICFDSLLAIPPGTVLDDLVLDEADQGLRHLLTSLTCNRGGKRPLLVQRFEQLVKDARRVILSSADLTKAEVDYICALREETPCILRNEHKSTSYPCTWIQCSDATAITGRIMAAAAEGLRMIVATDSLAATRQVAELLQPIVGESSILQIHSRTSGGDQEQAFIESPDRWLANHPQIKVVLHSPSIGSGVSIESDWPQVVFGLFKGQSITDSDAAQALMRVRRPVPRTVWAAKRGPANLANPLQRRTEQFDLAATTSTLIGDDRPMSRVDWLASSFTLWSHYAAERDYSLENFGCNLRARLETEGHILTIEEHSSDPLIRQYLSDAREEIKQRDAVAIVQARELDPDEAAALENKVALSPEDGEALQRYHLQAFYQTQLDPALVLFDNKGKTRKAINRLERFCFFASAIEKDRATVERLADADQITPQDLSHSELERKTLEIIGFYPFLKFALESGEWTKDHPMVQEIADKIRQYRKEIKVALNLTVTDQMANCQIVGEILRRLGLKTRCTRSRSVGRIYSLDRAHLNMVRSIIQRRNSDPPPSNIPIDQRGGSPAKIRELLLKPVPQTEVLPLGPPSFELLEVPICS